MEVKRQRNFVFVFEENGVGALLESNRQSGYWEVVHEFNIGMSGIKNCIFTEVENPLLKDKKGKQDVVRDEIVVDPALVTKMSDKKEVELTSGPTMEFFSKLFAKSDVAQKEKITEKLTQPLKIASLIITSESLFSGTLCFITESGDAYLAQLSIVICKSSLENDRVESRLSVPFHFLSSVICIFSANNFRIVLETSTSLYIYNLSLLLIESVVPFDGKSLFFNFHVSNQNMLYLPINLAIFTF